MKSLIPSTILILVSTTLLWAGDSYRVKVGEEMKIEGVVIQRTGETLLVESHEGREVAVILSASTRIEEKKTNPFRTPKKYTSEDLLMGLNIRVEGRGDTSGALLAREVKFTQDELKIAQTIGLRINRVESRMVETKSELQAADQELVATTQHLDHRVDELTDAFELAREEAGEAQSSANMALTRLDRHQERFGRLDEYQEIDNEIVNFEAGSARLTEQAKREIDELLKWVVDERGYLIEVKGFASADGDEDLNRRLSQERADAVVRYLVVDCGIPSRRVVQPVGVGEAQPLADNRTREGRRQNRRVELRVIQNQGVATTLDFPREIVTEQIAVGR